MRVGQAACGVHHVTPLGTSLQALALYATCLTLASVSDSNPLPLAMRVLRVSVAATATLQLCIVVLQAQGRTCGTVPSRL
jgi:hypothetical protein